MKNGVKISNKIRKYFELTYRFFLQKKLKNKDFTIISNNCWGGGVYEDLNLLYNTPFVVFFIIAPDYIKLLKDLRTYMSMTLTFTDISKYKRINQERSQQHGLYPIGVLNDIEIYFMHYKSKEEAFEKWERRKARINWNNLYIKFCDNDFCNHELAKEFDGLTYKNKVFFSVKNYNDVQSLVWFDKYKNEDGVGDLYSFKWRYRKYFNVVKWLNNV